jgi:uncharacterized protein involved in response to NO
LSPHRPFFFLGLCALAAASAWWLAQFAARSAGAPIAIELPASWIHAWSQLGVFPLFMFGFLFSAGPLWLRQPALPAARLAPAAVAMAAGWLVVVAAAHAGASLVAAGASVYAAGWAYLLWRLATWVRTSRVPERAHVRIASGALAVGLFAQLLFAAGIAARLPLLVHAALTLLPWLCLAPVFVTLAHRMLPALTAGLAGPIDDTLLFGFNALLVGHVGVAVAAIAWPSPLTAALRPAFDAVAGLLLLGVALRWARVQRPRSRLLAMLFVGFLWLPLALLLSAWQQLAMRMSWPLAGLGLAPLHALVMGCFGTMLFAMATRVTGARGGRALVDSGLTWTLFLLLQSAVLARLAAEALPSHAVVLTLAAASGWTVAAAGWAAYLLPVIVRPRARAA